MPAPAISRPLSRAGVALGFEALRFLGLHDLMVSHVIRHGVQWYLVVQSGSHAPDKDFVLGVIGLGHHFCGVPPPAMIDPYAIFGSECRLCHACLLVLTGEENSDSYVGL